MESREEYQAESLSKTSEQSTSTAYKILEEDFSQVIMDLNRHDRLGRFANEFQRMMDALRESHTKEQELSENNRSLKNQLASTSTKLATAVKITQSDQETIEKLQEEVAKAWKMTDSAHTREQFAQETIENLRLQGARLTQELETMRKMGTEQDQEVGALSKNKEALARERERLLAEIAHARERYAIGVKYQEELERRNDMVELKLSETVTELESQKTELAKEIRMKEKLEEEMKDLKADLNTKEQELQNQTIQATQSTKMVAKMELQVREERLTIDKQNKELQELQNTTRLQKMEYEQLMGNLETLQQELTAKNLEIKLKEEELAKVKADTKKLANFKESLENKMGMLVSEKGVLEGKKRDLQTQILAFEKEIGELKRKVLNEQKVIVKATRDKEMMARTIQKVSVRTHEQQRMLLLQDMTKKKNQEELHEQIENVIRQKAEISTLQNEKDRLVAESRSLNNQIQDQVEELKLKEMEIFDYKKRIASTDAKVKLQLAVYEQVRSERNQLSKNLSEAIDEINELKHKLKVKSYQVEQMKEDIRTKENIIVKEEFALQKVTKEKEEIKLDLQKTANELRDKKEQVVVLTQEEARLQKFIQDADKDRAKLAKDLNQVSNERDILGTQLVRRNDELNLLYEKEKILTLTLQKGEAQYGQRLEDIRLLKIEIKKLRQEKAMLARTVNNVSDLRQEMFHLEKDFIREKLKCRALEEELQNPLNVHRWRKLEGSDPTTFELIQKIQALQKRLMMASEEAIKRESQLKEAQRLHLNLKQVLKRQPGPEAFEKLFRCENALKQRGVKMKCLVAELTMYENQMSEYKVEKEQAAKQLLEIKKKYYSIKKREQKVKQKEKDLAQAKASLPVLEPITGKQSSAKFVGAGFNISTTSRVSRAQSVTVTAG